MSVISSLYGSRTESNTDDVPAPRRRAVSPALRFPRAFQAMAAFNGLAFVLSVLALVAGEAVLSLMLPQAWGLSPEVWGDDSGRAALWLAAIGIAVVLAGASALRAPAGSRTMRAVRAVTLFGFVVGVGSLAIVATALIV